MGETHGIVVRSVHGAEVALRLSVYQPDEQPIFLSPAYFAAHLKESTTWNGADKQAKAKALGAALEEAGFDGLLENDLDDADVDRWNKVAKKFIKKLTVGKVENATVLSKGKHVWLITNLPDRWDQTDAGCPYVDVVLELVDPAHAAHLKRGHAWGCASASIGDIPPMDAKPVVVPKLGSIKRPETRVNRARPMKRKETIEAAWEVIEAWGKKQRQAPKLGKGAAAKSLAALEKALSFPVPDELKRMLARHDGDNKTSFFCGWHYLSAADIIADRRFRRGFEGGRWVPVAVNGFEFIVIDGTTDQANSPSPVRIFRWTASRAGVDDLPDRAVIASSLTEWMWMFASGLSSGEITFEDGEWLGGAAIEQLVPSVW